MKIEEGLTQDFSENENQDHANEESGLLRGSSNTGITNNANRKTCSETSKTDSKACSKLNEAGVQWYLLS